MGRIVVVVAQSARYLAEMVVKSGWIAIAVDCYADSDTQQLSLETFRVKSLSKADLMPVLQTIAERYAFKGVVYGSGFEAQPDALVAIVEHWSLLGASPDVFQCFQDKSNFFENLTKLKIAYPETVFNSPETKGVWLQKPYRGQGGAQISYHQTGATAAKDEFYWQRFMPGEAGSLTFLASEQGANILGFNRQWVDDRDPDHPFIFSGICNRVLFDIKHRKILREILSRLLEIYPLRGLGSLDFIINDGVCYVLEINARIPASAQLYGRYLFNQHMDAVCGSLKVKRKHHHKPKGYQVIFALDKIEIFPGFVWPEWVVDRPADGAIISQGQPICSIIAGGKNARQVQMRLQQRQIFIQNILFTGC